MREQTKLAIFLVAWYFIHLFFLNIVSECDLCVHSNNNSYLFYFCHMVPRCIDNNNTNPEMMHWSSVGSPDPDPLHSTNSFLFDSIEQD